MTGNKMFEMVKEECERSLGRLEDKKRGVLYWGKRNGKRGYFTEKWEGVESENNKDLVWPDFKVGAEGPWVVFRRVEERYFHRKNKTESSK